MNVSSTIRRGECRPSRAVACVTLMTLTGFAFAQDLPLEDPMRPYSPAPSESARARDIPRVSAILISPSRRVAVIDGRSYGIGDLFNGAEILRIDSKSVHLRRGDRDFVMNLTVEHRRPTD